MKIEDIYFKYTIVTPKEEQLMTTTLKEIFDGVGDDNPDADSFYLTCYFDNHDTYYKVKDIFISFDQGKTWQPIEN